MDIEMANTNKAETKENKEKSKEEEFKEVSNSKLIIVTN